MKKKEGHILIVDDDKDVLATARMFLKQEFIHVQIENDPQQITHHLSQFEYDVVLLDMNFKKGESDGAAGMRHLNEILNYNPAICVIPMTAYGEIELAVKAVKAGAIDFISKPWENEKLLATINSAFKLRQSTVENQRLKETQKTLSQDLEHGVGTFIGQSTAFLKVLETIKKVAPTDAGILLLGENGTGKELAARAIHKYSDRADNVFISVDLGSLSENLFESELFGHVKGAFTDAVENKIGRFELAHGGTIFLDEIGNLSPPLQSKLLTVLQNQKVTPVGSSKEIPINARIVCATNMKLYEMVQDGSFRQDLLYRINTVEIELPPLRERLDDIPLLINHFLELFGKKYHKPKLRIDKSMLSRFEKNHWPGNIRELEHTIERAVILNEGQLMDAANLMLTDSSTSLQTNDTLNLKENEKKLIIQALEQHQGNITRAAKELGIDRLALYRRMEKYGI
ncbi:MAG: sigma-54 dependent transcriptional regulator [Cyclobacteriaceae bacterium]